MKKRVSFVIPCYRSENTLGRVVEEIDTAMAELDGKYEYEIILVCDASPDNTYGRIEELAAKRTEILGINLARNFGQHAAIMAGLHYVSGDYTVCMDDDGQTPASEVGKLLEALENGLDAVYARYSNKMHSRFRNLGSFVNEKMAQYLLGKPKELYISSYFAVRGFVVKEMLKYDKSYPYLIGLVLRTTCKTGNVEVTHRERLEGHSGYTLGKLLNLWMNGFTAFSVTPLRVSTCTGCILALCGFAYGLYTIIKHYYVGEAPMGYASIMSALLLIGGMVMIMLGLVGEYIGRMYIGINNAPQYIIRETTREV